MIDELYRAKGILHLLEDGYYLYRWKDVSGTERSKFLTPADVRMAFTELDYSSGFLPAGTIAVGINKQGPFYVTYHPASVQTISLADYNGEFLMFQVPLPPIIQILSRSISFYAYQTGEVKPNGKVYQLPLPNVGGDSGTVCWGNSKPHKDLAHAMDTWHLFFSTAFSNHSVEGKIKNKKHDGWMPDVREFLIEIKGKPRFPMSRLIYQGKLHEVLERYHGIRI